VRRFRSTIIELIDWISFQGYKNIVRLIRMQFRSLLDWSFHCFQMSEGERKTKPNRRKPHPTTELTGWFTPACTWAADEVIDSQFLSPLNDGVRGSLHYIPFLVLLPQYVAAFYLFFVRSRMNETLQYCWLILICQEDFEIIIWVFKQGGPCIAYQLFSLTGGC
jgi:hypothetical protein